MENENENDKSEAAYDSYEQELQQTDEIHWLSEQVLSLVQDDCGPPHNMRTESMPLPAPASSMHATSDAAYALKIQADQEAMDVQLPRRTESMPSQFPASSMHATSDATCALKIQADQEAMNVQLPRRTESMPLKAFTESSSMDSHASSNYDALNASSDTDALKTQEDQEALTTTESAAAERPPLMHASSDSCAVKIQAAQGLNVPPPRRAESAPQLFNNHARPGAYFAAPGMTELVGTESWNSRREVADVEEESGSMLADDAEVSKTETSQEDTMSLSEEVSVFAVIVEDGAEEQRVRRRIFDEAVQAEVVEPIEKPSLDEHGNGKWRKSSVRLLVACGILVLMGVVIGLSLGLTKKSDGDGEDGTLKTNPPEPFMPTLEVIRQRGVLRCGHSDVLHHIRYNPVTNERVGFEIDLCRAIAAIALGDPELYEIVDIPLEGRFTELAIGSIDLYLRVAPTMGRDLYEETSKVGFTFSIPHIYGGVAFGGNEFFVQCADDLNTQGDCSDLQVCAATGTIHASVVGLILPNANILHVPAGEIAGVFGEGRCNVIISNNWDLALVLIGDAMFGPGQTIGNILQRESLGIATRDDDTHWSDVVNWTIQSLIKAEAQGITQSTAQNFVAASNFGSGSEFVFQNAIAAVGNYGELYERHYEWFLPRDAANLINVKGTTGLLRTPLFDGMSDSGPEPVAGGELEAITRNGHLTCGITDQRLGFAEFDSSSGQWSGLDVDYCRALTSCIFFGRVTDETLVFREFDSPEEGHSALADGTVDVLCGQRISVRGDISGYATGEGFAFSLPYFYEAPDSFGSTRALATRQSGPQWSSFVYWVVVSTIYAEEKKITRSSSNAMPEVKLFGFIFRRMFRDAILAVGNYEEMYARNVEAIIPRSGFNLLNTEEPIGPQHFPFPFDD